MGVTTEAYVARESGLKLEEVHYADLASHELLVDIVSVSACHSDVRAAEGTFRLARPLVLGHEGAGYVKEVGSSVTYVKPGDAVVLSYTSCGKCKRCLSGKQPYCDSIGELNFSGRREDGSRPVKDEDGNEINGLFFGQSSMSRVALVHENSAVKLDCSKEDLRLFAPLACGIQTGAGAISNVARPPIGSSIAVWGGGAVGLSAIMAAKLTSPACLVLIDNSEAKLATIAQELLKGVHIINSSDLKAGSVANKLRGLSPDGQGMDYALDCVGNEAVVIEAHDSLTMLGTLITCGSSATATAGFKLVSQLAKGITYRGTHQGDSVPRVMIPHLISLWRQGLFPFDKLLTTFAFEDLAKALEETHAGRAIKPLLLL